VHADDGDGQRSVLVPGQQPASEGQVQRGLLTDHQAAYTSRPTGY